MEKFFLYDFHISQRVWREMGFEGKLDAVDLLLFSALYTWFNRPSLHHIIGGQTYILVTLQFIRQNCPILGINSRSPLYNRMQKLVNAELIERYENNQIENKSYYRRGRLFNCFDSAIEKDEPVLEKDNVSFKKDRGVFGKEHYNNINYKNNIPLVSKETSPKGEDAYPEIERQLTLFEEEGIQVAPGTKEKLAEMFDIADAPTTFEKFWNMYDKKCGRLQAYNIWCRLAKKDRQAIFDYLPDYIASTPDKQYRLNPTTFLNPNRRRWEDEIINKNDNGNRDNTRNAIPSAEFLDAVHKAEGIFTDFFNSRRT